MPHVPTGFRYRGLLIHLSHYDPNWLWGREERFDLRVGLELVDAMADIGMNLLVIDIEDGVVFKTHPELRRRYSVPIAQLETLARAAHQLLDSLSRFHPTPGVTPRDRVVNRPG